LLIYLFNRWRQELEEQTVRPRRSYEKDITSPRGRRSFEKDTPKYIYPATPEDEVVRASFASQTLTARALYRVMWPLEWWVAVAVCTRTIPGSRVRFVQSEQRRSLLGFSYNFPSGGEDGFGGLNTDTGAGVRYLRPLDTST
jgi:hypothetical protein